MTSPARPSESGAPDPPAAEVQQTTHELDADRRVLETIAENATLALFVMDARQQCTYMNPAAERLTGFTLGEVQGRALHDVIHHTRPDGSPYPLAECPIDRAFPQNMREQGEEVFVHKDGSFYEVAFTASPIREGGRTVGTIIEVRDVREEKARERETARLLAAEREARLQAEESERRFREMADAAPVLIWTSGTDAGYDWVNQPWLAYSGRTLDEVVGNGWTDVVHPDDRDRRRTTFLDAFHARRPFSMEYRLRRHDGVYRWFLDNAAPRFAADGTFVGYVGTGVDVTEQRASREAAETARTDAEEAARLKTEFLSTMSHEFRTPLNAILGYAQLLAMGVLGPATPAQHAHLERLQGSARHLLRLIDDVLDVAKVDADRLEVRRDTLMTGAAVAASVTLVHPQATAKGVRLMDLGAGEAGVPYVGDEHRVRQILVNVLANAVKFTPPGGEVTVACGAAAEPEPGVWRPEGGAEPGDGGPRAWAFVRVEDTGPGIPAELLGRLFEPFVQGDSALTRAQGGTGLGLAISRRLARRMGGDLTVRTRPGGGASVALWLPSLDAPEPMVAATHGASRQTPALGAAAIAEPPTTPLDEAAYAVLHALGVRLAADAETISQRYVAALRADGRFPGAHALPAVQLRDHATPFVGLLASQLMVIGETRGQAAELLADGGQMQRMMAELHGAQRQRLGWAEADIERETPLLLAEIERALREAVDMAAIVELADGAVLSGIQVSARAVGAAAAYAVHVARHVLHQSTRTAIRAYRFAKADVP